MVSADPVNWRTASFGDAPDTSPADLETLGQHVSGCSAANGRLVALRCAAWRLRGFVASHLVSTLVAGLLLAALVLALV